MNDREDNMMPKMTRKEYHLIQALVYGCWGFNFGKQCMQYTNISGWVGTFAFLAFIYLAFRFVISKSAAL